MSLQPTIQPKLHKNGSTCSNQKPCFAKPIQVPTQTLGAEMQTRELASLQAPVLTKGIQLSTAFDVDPDDFERIYRWFLS
jgi:hypothetical protein